MQVKIDSIGEIWSVDHDEYGAVILTQGSADTRLSPSEARNLAAALIAGSVRAGLGGREQ